MKFETKYRLCLWRAWFVQGDALMNYAKYLIAFFGLTSRDLFITLTFAAIYAISAFFLGRAWYVKGFVKAELEVGNRYNRFVSEMRRKMKNKNR